MFYRDAPPAQNTRQWVPESKQTVSFGAARDICNHEASRWVTEWTEARGVRPQNTDSGAIYNFATSMGKRKERDKAFRACMRKQGFKPIKKCVERCKEGPA